MKIPTPLSPSSPNIINVENNLSTPNKTIQKRELLKGVGVEGEGEENIRSVQQKQVALLNVRASPLVCCCS